MGRLPGVFFAGRRSVTALAAGSLAAATLVQAALPSVPAAAAVPAPSAAVASALGPASASASAAPAVNPHDVGGQVPVAVAAVPGGPGLWAVSTDGAVTAEGGAASYGGAQSQPLSSPVVGIAAHPGGGGYWEVTAAGGVYAFGAAAYHGGLSGVKPSDPIVGLAATADGGGYWLAARNGHVFPFGDAANYGSPSPKVVDAPVVAIASPPNGAGYWLFGRDGSVYTMGGVRYHGSLRGTRPTTFIVAAGATPSGGGYWMVEHDGSVFAFGDAADHGGATPASANPSAPVVGMSPTADGGGYWLLLGSGEIAAYGDATPSTVAVPSAGFSLAGYIVGIDPGHNGGNGADPSYINRPIWNGREVEGCDTTGTSTDAGYPESAFNFDVATRLEAVLRSLGATVVMTRTSNDGVGPCVTTRSAIINASYADAAVDIHADGGPAGGRGVAVLLPVADGPNNKVIGTSDELGRQILSQFRRATGEPDSTYDGRYGLQPRNDLAGLNLTTVSKILIECANMRNATDASLVTSSAWRQKAATGMAWGLSEYLTGYP